MQTSSMSPAVPRPGVKTVLGAWLHPRTWASLGHVTVGMIVTTVTFTLVVTAVAVSFGLLFALLIGIPFLGLTLLMTQGLGAFDRARYRLFLGEEIASPHVPVKGNAWVWFRKRVLSGAAWKEVLWFLLTWPLTLAAFVIVISLASWSVALVALPCHGSHGAGRPWTQPWLVSCSALTPRPLLCSPAWKISPSPGPPPWTPLMLNVVALNVIYMMVLSNV
jgi:Putative sensor